ncbi:hypothetical protein K505DRAFT_362117 [Melanomma pulvis-pyrius CBS 109.77]|uniref:RING-type domain-containing protein n=1 Tax=Melanomma pulvis-pyrius CBS 109.77 TaxID=1314802 RepID=A0A6A6XAY2_9PLEO|nr:hypothetical protein K505DRAFT_362117 [Melanomma pulvis-pyrius CBS 109.77]
MPAVLSNVVNTALLEARRDQPFTDRRSLSPTAIGFLVPLFVCIFFGPFICALCIRNRREGRMQEHIAAAKRPAVRREIARKRLSEVTEVAKLEYEGGERFAYKGTMNERSEENTSTLERDCAICLSTLHLPSPPEPIKAKLATLETTTETISSSKHASISNLSLSDKEEILKLRACGHEFHAECLTSWFVIRKYSCPICRAIYYSKERGIGMTGGEEQREEGERSREEV